MTDGKTTKKEGDGGKGRAKGATAVSRMGDWRGAPDGGQRKANGPYVPKRKLRLPGMACPAAAYAFFCGVYLGIHAGSYPRCAAGVYANGAP